MDADQRYAKWLRWLKIITSDITHLAIHRHVFWETSIEILPVFQDDWKAIFREPWIVGEAGHPDVLLALSREQNQESG